jgi:hypothetical protein
MEVVWDGVTKPETLDVSVAATRATLADAAKNYTWPKVFKILASHPEIVNCCRPGGSSLYAPLHQAAHGGASEEVVGKLIELGAWRTLQNAHGERPVDVAKRTGHAHLSPLLEPVYRRRVPTGVLRKIQEYFHEVIHRRADELVRDHALRLPELEPLLELEEPVMWFAVPGMYGGFSYRLEGAGAKAVLVSESWSRIALGSGQRHEITSAGSKLVAEGFV